MGLYDLSRGQLASAYLAVTHAYFGAGADGKADVRNLAIRNAATGLLAAQPVRLNPNSPEAHNNLGLVLLMQGQPEKSIPEFSTALRLRPEFRLAQETLNRAQAKIKARRG